ncbi:MAG: hypothetical protein ACI4MM_09225 [Candidatus Ventricola sp.]
MKGTAWICLLLTLILVLMGVQTYALWQKTQALEAALLCALDDLSVMKESISSIAEVSGALGSIWNRLAQEGGLLSFLTQP